MIKEIIKYNNPLLNTISEDVVITDDINSLITDLKDTLAVHISGIGLSAIQIGIPKRIFITHPTRYSNYNKRFYIY